MRITFLILLVLVTLPGLSQGPRVPSQMEVAGIRLKLTESARKDIQKDVDALTRSQKHFNIKLDKVRMYFPLIEKIFREENVPEDFKYLVIQESGLIGDAVSSSNAVGYWQFKEFTGKEVGLRIDRNIDERMHIIAASRGAAKYFKKNNFYFDNWLYALQAYQMGPGGALKVVDKKNYGASKMQITKNTYWYVKKFLAHKVAFEKAYKTNPRNGMMLAEYKRSSNKNLRDVSKEVEVPEEDLRPYNLWLRKGRVPVDKDYVFLIPIKTMEKKKFVDDEPAIASSGFKNVYPNEDPDKFPLIKDLKSAKNYTQEVIKANGLPGIVAKEGDSFDWLALQGAVTTQRFFGYNDISKNDQPIPGAVYYFKRKKGKARIHYHVVQRDETLWDVSQKYGIKLKKLMQKNRMKEAEALEEGRVLWLRFIRPADHPIEYKPVPVPEVEVEEVEQKEEVEPIFEEDTVATDSLDVRESIPESSDTAVVVSEEPMEESSVESDTAMTEVPVVEEVPEEEPEVKYNEEKILHTVEKGETLYGIARTYEVPVDDMIRWNNIEIDENYKLSIGEQLTILKMVPVEEILEPDVKLHKVEPGETLYQISKKYGLTVEELMELNDMVEVNLSPGDELKVIEQTEKEIEIPDGTLFHEVQPGETLYQIAKKYELTIQELMDLNQKEEFDIQVGEKLQVSKED